MPIWAIVYCGIIIIGSLCGLYDKDKIKKSYQPFGEILCGISGIYIFIAAFYETWNIHIVVTTAAFIYVNFWFYHAHRHYFTYEGSRDYIHSQNLENDKKLKNELGDYFEPQYSFERSEKETKYFYIFLVLFSILNYLVLLYVYLLSVGVL